MPSVSVAGFLVLLCVATAGCDQLEFQPRGAGDQGLPPPGVLTALSTDDIPANDGFGDSAAILGRDLFVGAPTNDAADFNAGAIYRYTLGVDGYQDPLQIVAPTPQGNGSFGESLAACEPFLFVGGDCGGRLEACTPSVHVFVRDSAGGLTFRQRIDGPLSTNYGNRIACDAATLAVSSHPSGPGAESAVYLYERQPDDSWSGEQRVVAAAPVAGARLAERLAVAGEWLAVSNRGGQGLLFRREGGLWVDRSSEHAALPGGPSEIILNGDELFWHVTDSGLYHRFGTQWLLEQALTGDAGFGDTADYDADLWAIANPTGGDAGEGTVTWFRTEPSGRWVEAGTTLGPNANGAIGASATRLLNGLLLLTNETRQEAFVMVVPE